MNVNRHMLPRMLQAPISQEESTNRSKTIDILRGLAILSVIFGHITHIAVLRSYIWGFHIPLFFFISGLLFRKDRYSTFKSFCNAQTRRILLPYVFFYLVTITYWILIERRVRGEENTLISQFIGLPYGTYSMDYMMFNGALWFLPALCSVELLYWSISRHLDAQKDLLLSICVGFLGIFFSNHLYWLPWGGNAALIGCTFYALGVCCKPYTDFLCRWWIVPIAFVLQYASLPWTGADLASLSFPFVWAYFPIAIVGIVFSYALATTIKSRILEWMGRVSLVLFAFQEPVYRAVIFAVSKIVHQETEMIRTNLLFCIICTIITILCIWPITVIYFRHIAPLFKRLCSPS